MLGYYAYVGLVAVLSSKTSIHLTFVCTPFSFILDESGTAENKVEVLFSHDKLSLTSILRPLHQVTKEMLV